MQTEQQVKVQIPEVVLDGSLVIPNEAKGIVLFAHGSGSSRFSPRNRYVAQYLVDKQMATLLIDLLSREEEIIDEVSREFRFDINLLATRLVGVIDWIKNNKKIHKLDIGLFGSSTGAAAALVAAAQKRNDVKSVVSRGGRPDLAASYLKQVIAPTLLIVGGLDEQVIEFNQEALELIPGTKVLEIVPGATHLFEEPGTLEFVAHLAGQWFSKYLG